MKSLVFSCSIIFALLVVTTGLRCWVCENVFGDEECRRTGSMEECEPTQNTCQLTLRHGGWGEGVWFEKSCKQLQACGSNHIQDSKDASVFLVENTQCNRKIPSSVCRCCCSTDGCNQNWTSCEGPLGGLPCPSLDKPKHGEMECMGGNIPNSACFFRCKSGYRMVGAAVSRCGLFSQRDNPAPTCERIQIRCPELKEQTHGSYTCSRRNLHRSRCNFTCDAEYKFVGARQIECYQDFRSATLGTWSRPQPQCKPYECPNQVLRNGRVRCTDRNFVGSTCTFECKAGYTMEPATGRGSNTCQRDETWTREPPRCVLLECPNQVLRNGRVRCTNRNFFGTTCTFQCRRGYTMEPATGRRTNTCQRDETWSKKPPCCVLRCPPNAFMDFVVVMDSSSSVGEENWGQMKAFVRSFLSEFNVRDDASHFAVIRYNRVVDTNTQILLNDYPNSLPNFLRAFDRIPYDGSGTFTGNAINYTASTLLKTGNRPDAIDVVLLITDGASQDDVVVPSQLLHATNALIFVLPVQPPRGSLDLNEIEIIAKNPSRVIRDALEGGFAALDEAFAKRIGGLLCKARCAP